MPSAVPLKDGLDVDLKAQYASRYWLDVALHFQPWKVRDETIDLIPASIPVAKLPNFFWLHIQERCCRFERIITQILPYLAAFQRFENVSR